MCSGVAAGDCVSTDDDVDGSTGGDDDDCTVL